jgi:nitrite reductase/ring-hydroxylating ferredoxin subunit
MNSKQNQQTQRFCLNRREFLAVSSGCVLGVAARAATGKLPLVDIGTVKDYAEDGISVKFIQDDFFVIRYQGKLFAASTVCPHMGHTLQRDPNDSARIICGRHGSAFDAEGLVTVGPASSGLVRLGIAVNDKGRVIVNPNQEFPQDKWGDSGCFIAVK